MDNIPAGSMARLTEASKAFPEGRRTYSAGTRFTVADFVSADESEDGVAFYWGHQGEGNYNNVTFPASIVELALTKAEMGAREIPTGKEIMEQIWGDIASEADGIGRVHTSEWNHDHTAVFEVTHENGLEYAFEVAVTRVERTNW